MLRVTDERAPVLLFIHRSFFAQAILEQPINPLKSNYAPSFLAAYRASTTILKSVKELYEIAPSSAARHLSMWTQAFGAAVCNSFAADYTVISLTF